MMKRVYVAGPFSADNVIDVLDNMRRGMRLCTEVMLAGCAPFCPWFDYHFQLMLRGTEHLTVNDYYDYSTAWLKASDAVLRLPGWEDSKGAWAEIAQAREMNIPVFDTVDDLAAWAHHGRR
jgi:hypothetical protein